MYVCGFECVLEPPWHLHPSVSQAEWVDWLNRDNSLCFLNLFVGSSMDEFTYHDPFLIEEIRALERQLSRSISEEVLKRVAQEFEKNAPGSEEWKKQGLAYPTGNIQDFVKAFRL